MYTYKNIYIYIYIYTYVDVLYIYILYYICLHIEIGSGISSPQGSDANIVAVSAAISALSKTWHGAQDLFVQMWHWGLQPEARFGTARGERPEVPKMALFFKVE